MTAPTNSSGASTVHRLRNSSRFGKEFVVDRPIVSLWGWKGSLFGNLRATALVTGSAGDAIVDDLGGGPRNALFFDTDGDAHEVMWKLPDDIDLAQAIRFRILWSNTEAAATGSALLTVKYRVAPVGTFDMGLAAAATALDTAIVNQVDLAEDVFQYTSWGVLDADTLSGTPGEDYISVLAELTTKTTVASVDVYDVHAQYYRKWLGARG